MFEIQIAPVRGLLAGVHYSNEDLEGVEPQENLQHTLQICLFLLIFNVIWYTTREEE
jgi:hypothetical protein